MARVTPRLISMTIDAVDRSDEVSSFKITSNPADGGFTTFFDARSGGKRKYTAVMTIAQDHASDTLWDLIWTGPGEEVDVTYAPHGNAVATALQPHYEGILIVAEPDGDFMGADATSDPLAVATVSVTWEFKAKPTKVTT